MKIRITGDNQKLSFSETRRATRFMAGLLMSKKLLDTLQLDIRFEGCPGYKGSTDYLDTNERPRIFEVQINPKMSKRNQLLTLAHELVHVKQFAKGELKEYMKKHTSAMRWGNEVIQVEEDAYWDLPWEIEAYGRECGLYIRWVEHKNRTESRSRNKP